MPELINSFFNPGQFILQGYCDVGKPELVGLHIVADSIIALAYYSISITLTYFVGKRGELPFNWIFLLFSTFFIAGGTTYLLEVWTWHPQYWLSGFFKAIAAATSLYTAVQLVLLLPKALDFPSLAIVNQKLEREILERQQVEAALRKSKEQYRVCEKRLRTILDAEPECVKVIDTDGKLVEMNPAGLAMLEADDISQVLGAAACQIVTPPHRESWMALMERAYQGESGSLQLEIIGLKGKYLWLDTHVVPIRDEQNKITEVLGITRDITQQKQAEEALCQSEERLRLALDAANMGSWEWNLLTNHRTWSSGMEQLFGLEVGVFDGTYETFIGCVHPEDREGITQALNRAMLEQQDYHHQVRVVWPDGSIHWIEAKGKCFCNEKGQAVRMLGTCVDISDRILAQTALQKAKNELASRVLERTQQLTYANAQLESELLEHQRTQKQLQDQAQLLELAHDAIVTLDLNDTITFWNRGAEVMYGFSKAEALGKEIDTLLQTQFSKPLPEIEAELFEKGSWEGESIQTKRDGTQIVVSSRWVVQRDIGGRPIEVLEINRDISPRKQAEKALKASRARLAGILDIAEDAIISVDSNQKITLFNQGAEKIFGYSVQEALGQPLDLLMPLRFAHAHRQHVAGFSKSDTRARTMGQRGEIFGRRKDGTEFPAEASISQLELSGERILTVILRDISDRKQALEALRESEQRYRQMFEANQAKLLIDPESGAIVDANPAAKSFYGYEVEQLKRMKITDLNSLPTHQVFTKMAQTARQRHGEYEFRHRLASGEIRDVVVYSSALVLREQLLLYSIIHDITERKQAEEALRQSEAQIREKATSLKQALRQLQLTQSQLIQAEKMSSLGQMVAGIAHEINNPVNFIYGNICYTEDYLKDLLNLVQLYQQHSPNPNPEIKAKEEEIDLEFISGDLFKVLKSLKMGTERIRKIVLSLRNFSRLDEAEKKKVDLHEGIDNTLLILNHRLGKEINIIKEYGDIPPFLCYPAQLNQVFMSILNNAIDSLLEQPTPKIITICTEVVDGEEGSNLDLPPPFVLIRIRDNGFGIHPEIKNKIFDPFFTTKPVGQGTGLGLSISYQIIKKHGGLIEVNSQPGEGTEFAIAIPIHQPATSPLP